MTLQDAAVARPEHGFVGCRDDHGAGPGQGCHGGDGLIGAVVVQLSQTLQGARIPNLSNIKQASVH